MSKLEDIVDKFNSQTLTKEKWTHEAHLTVASWYCKSYDMPKALDLLLYHIKICNISVGTPNSDTQGYHETLTRFWLIIAANYVCLNQEKSFYETADTFENSDWENRNLALVFYSKEILFSIEARQNWVEPDLAKLTNVIEMAVWPEKMLNSG